MPETNGKGKDTGAVFLQSLCPTWRPLLTWPLPRRCSVDLGWALPSFELATTTYSIIRDPPTCRGQGNLTTGVREAYFVQTDRPPPADGPDFDEEDLVPICMMRNDVLVQNWTLFICPPLSGSFLSWQNIGREWQESLILTRLSNPLLEAQGVDPKKAPLEAHC